MGHYMTHMGGRQSVLRLVGKGARRVRITTRDYHREKYKNLWGKNCSLENLFWTDWSPNKIFMAPPNHANIAVKCIVGTLRSVNP